MEVNFLSHSGQMQSGCLFLFLSLKALPPVEEPRREAGVVVVLEELGVELFFLLLLVGEGCVDSSSSSSSESSFLRKPRSSMS